MSKDPVVIFVSVILVKDGEHQDLDWRENQHEDEIKRICERNRSTEGRVHHVRSQDEEHQECLVNESLHSF